MSLTAYPDYSSHLRHALPAARVPCEGFDFRSAIRFLASLAAFSAFLSSRSVGGELVVALPLLISYACCRLGGLSGGERPTAAETAVR